MMARRKSYLRLYLVSFALGLGAILAGILVTRQVRSDGDRAAEIEVEAAIGATIERDSSWSLLGQGGGPVVVTSVATDSLARAIGLRVGDVIVDAGQRVVRSPADVARSLPEATAARLTVDRQGARFQMTLPTRARAMAVPGGASVPQVADH